MAATTTVLGLLKPAYSDDSDIGDINGNMDLIDAEAAKVRGNVAADYDSAQTYAVGDYCIHDGNLYKCNTTISSPEAWTAGHWTQIEIAGELTALYGKIATQQIIPITSAYLKGIAYCTKDLSGNVSVLVDFCTLTDVPNTVAIAQVPSLFSPSADTNAVVVQTISIANKVIAHAYYNEGADIRSTGVVRQRITTNLSAGLHGTFMFQYSV